MTATILGMPKLLAYSQALSVPTRHPVIAMDDDQREIGGAHRAQCLPHEIEVTGRVENVEFLPEPFGVQQRSLH